MEYNLLLSLFILITWIVPALFCGRRPTVLVCPDLRGLPGCGLSVLKLGKPWPNADELITKPVGALPIGSRVCWVQFWAFCVYILTFRCHKMFQAHLTLTLTRLQVTCISLRRPGTRAFGVLGYTTPWELEQMELIQLLYRPHSHLPLHLFPGCSLCQGHLADIYPPYWASLWRLTSHPPHRTDLLLRAFTRQLRMPPHFQVALFS